MRPDDAIAIVERIPLGPIQRAIAECLASRYGRWVSTRALINAAYALRPDGGPLHAKNVIKQHVHQLRPKLRQVGIVIIGHNAGDHGRKMLAFASQGEPAPRATNGHAHGAGGRR